MNEEQPRDGIKRYFCNPSKKTFDIMAINERIKQELENANNSQLLVDPFANDNAIRKFIDPLFPERFPITITNDMNQIFNTDFNILAEDFLPMIGSEVADYILFDPPYSANQVKVSYENYGIHLFKGRVSDANFQKMKNECIRILKPGGRAFVFGWDSNGLGNKKKAPVVEVLICYHGGRRHDTIMTVCEKLGGTE